MRYLSLELNQTIFYTMGGQFSSKRKWEHPTDKNDDYEVVIITEGKWKFVINQITVILYKGDGILIPPHTNYSEFCTDSSNSFVWLHFLPDKSTIIDITEADQVLNEISTDTASTFNIPFSFSLDNLNQVLITVYKLLNKQVKDIFKFYESNHLISYILLLIASDHVRQLQESNFDLPSKVTISKVKNYIRANMSAKLNLKEISSAFKITPQYLSRQFSLSENKTISSYITNEKIKVAELLLVQTTLSVKEIAFQSFYNTEKQFFVDFKKITGTTPLKYRNAYGTIHTNNPKIDPELPIPRQAMLRIIEERNKGRK